ncbi:hypothetical protein [Mesorhizobium sp.]|uniref:hypothetical protein n=1 Tax=Mesorhizobium sp. TaxID=1871066 RepID=UPI000FE94D4A|nr:hypothetical protein [Mesorhizobium sp.]RWO87962.1 MAG: hypothetical protein EOQ96_10475 [Mesorhizobium sp.]
MSEFHFVAVLLDSPGRADKDMVIEQLNRANDWIEFRDRSWLIWTKQSSKTWYGRLKPVLAKGDNVFVCAVDINDRGGLMPRSFWDFVRKKTG